MNHIFLKSLQQPDGGFIATPMDAKSDAAPRSSLRSTSAGVRAIKYFGGEVPNADKRIIQGLSTELRLPVADLPAHLVSPAILTLADNGDIGVKTLNAENIVEFHPVTIVADGPDGIWLAGLPEKVTFITVGQEFVQPGQKVQPVPETGASGT
jgi:hypothetical protein